MSLSIKLGNFLYKYCFTLYKPLYRSFKLKQDDFEIALLKKHIQKGNTVLDIGANIGFYATILSDLVGPQGKVYCFEPDEKNFNYLQIATGSHKNIIINQAAVGARTENIKMYTSPNLNVDHRTYEPEQYDKVIEVRAVSTDDYLAENAPGAKIDLIKMDIQGFEMQALSGMSKTLKTNENILIISEFWPYGLKKAGSSVSDYFSALKSQNFKCYLLDKRSLKPLSMEMVKNMEHLPEKDYFNIIASRTDV